MTRIKYLIIGMIVGLIIGLGLGVNIGKEKPLLSNPFEEPTLGDKLKQTGGEVLEKGGDVLKKTGEALQENINDEFR